MEFIRHTRFLGKPIAYGAKADDSQPKMPFTALGMVNCSCGTTIDISTKNMDLATVAKLLKWGVKEKRNRGCTMSELMDDLRHKIDEIELGEDTGPSVLENQCKQSNA